MPNRILKESICTSENLDTVPPMAEILFYRLIVNCDDFGRFDARPAIILAACFPLKVSEMALENISEWLHELEKAGLVEIYHVRGKSYIQMKNWLRHQNRRAKNSKYPEPDCSCNQPESICKQMYANVPEESRNRGSEESRNIYNTPASADAGECDGLIPAGKTPEGVGAQAKTPGKDESGNAAIPVENPPKGGGTQGNASGKDGYTEEFLEFWRHYPRKLEKKAAFRRWKTLIKRKIAPVDLIRASRNYDEYCRKSKTEPRFIKHATTFLGPDNHFEDFVHGIPEATASSAKPENTGKKVPQIGNFRQRNYSAEFYDRLKKSSIL